MRKRKLSPIAAYVLILASVAKAGYAAQQAPANSSSLDVNSAEVQASPDVKLALWAKPAVAKKHTLTEEELKLIQIQNSKIAKPFAGRANGRDAADVFVGTLAAGTAAILIHLFYVPFSGAKRVRKRGDLAFVHAQTKHSSKGKPS